ncbi:helix-turn-helix domain-containing protein [Cupriavidus necator]
MTDQPCSTCPLGRFCLPNDLDPAELPALDAVAHRRLRLKKGALVYRVGDPVMAIYAVRLGTLKSHVATEDGRSQIVGFHLQGEILGMDSVFAPVHLSSATALEDTQLCVLPVSALRAALPRLPSLRRQLVLALAQEAQHDRVMMTTIGLMTAEERLVAFLLGLSKRLSARGFAANEFVLRMSREEIGSYLGLKLETISRLLSRLAEAGMIAVHHRRIRLLQPDALRSIHRRSRSVPALEPTDRCTASGSGPAPAILDTLATP